MAERIVVTRGAMDDDVQSWLYKLDRGIERREEEEDRWSVNEAFEDMRHWSDSEGDYRLGNADEPTINKISSFIKTFRAAICYRNPAIKVTPKGAAGWKPVVIPVLGEDGQPVIGPDGKPQTKTVLRYLMFQRLLNEIVTAPMFNLADTVSRVVKSGCLAYGAAMVGYKPTFETAPKKDDDEGDDGSIKINEDGTLDLEDYQINPLNGLPVIGKDGKPIRKRDCPVWEDWFIDWTHYRKIIIDPDGGNDFLKHRWVAIEEVRTLEEVKGDPLFKNTDDLEATGALSIKEESVRRRADGTTRFTVHDKDDCKTVRLFRIFDLVKDRMIVLADGHGKALYDEEMPLGITHSPLVTLRFNEIIGENEEFYPRPPVTELVPLASENNYLRMMALKGAKKNVRKVIIEPNVFTPEEEEKFGSDVDMEVVHMDKRGQYGPDKVAYVMNVPTVSGDVWNTLMANKADFDEVSGQGAEARGRSTGSESATGVSERSRNSGARNDFDRQLLARFLTECFKKLADSVQANMTVPRAVEIVGEDGQAFYTLVDREMIACDYDVSVDVVEMAPTDSAQEAAQMIQLAQVLGQNRWMATREEILRPMCERVRIRDENFITGVMEAAKEAIAAEQAMMQAKAQPKVPNAPPPSNPEQMMEQMAGGQQIPNMQGAA